MDQELVLISLFAGPSFIFIFSLLFFLLLRFRNGDEEKDQPEAGKQKSRRGSYRTFLSFSDANSKQTTTRRHVVSITVPVGVVRVRKTT